MKFKYFIVVNYFYFLEEVEIILMFIIEKFKRKYNYIFIGKLFWKFYREKIV